MSIRMGLALGLSCLSLGLLSAQAAEDGKAIKAMCGCFEVNFAFVETFSPDAAYELHKPHQSGGVEWVELVEDKPGFKMLQHILIVQDSAGKEEIVKHWRQDWHYQLPELYTFEKDRTWRFVRSDKAAVKGQWTQRVFQVDDGPRYDGRATWFQADRRQFWEAFGDTPLPRREFTTRNDYNVLRRRNRHEITSWGWVHEQDNEKILRQDGQPDKLIAKEKGWNTYTRVPDERCQAGRQWWKENQAFWAFVRQAWDKEVFGLKRDFQLLAVKEGKPLFMHLAQLKPEQKAEAQALIREFLVKPSK